MVDTNKLKGIYIGKGYTQKSLAEEIGISERTLNSKINNKSSFGSEEIEKLIIVLKIENPVSIFFAHKVT